MDEGWFPSTAPYRYLGVDASLGPKGRGRPVSHGDVFEAVPIVRRAASIPNERGDRKAPTVVDILAIVVSHPCTIREGRSGSLSTHILMAPVFPMKKVAAGWKRPWPGNLDYFPLPTLLDGNDYAADLTRIQTALDTSLVKRVAVLNEEASIALARRLSHFFTRTEPALAKISARWEAHGLELALWEEWTHALGDPSDFHEWLDEHAAVVDSGPTRRDRLMYEFTTIQAEMVAEMSRRLP